MKLICHTKYNSNFCDLCHTSTVSKLNANQWWIIVICRECLIVEHIAYNRFYCTTYKVQFYFTLEHIISSFSTSINFGILSYIQFFLPCIMNILNISTFQPNYLSTCYRNTLGWIHKDLWIYPYSMNFLWLFYLLNFVFNYHHILV